MNKAEMINKIWKTALCLQGEICWCRMIKTEDAPDDIDLENDDLETIIPSGVVYKEFAEHIVEIHNNFKTNRDERR